MKRIYPAVFLMGVLIAVMAGLWSVKKEDVGGRSAGLRFGGGESSEEQLAQVTPVEEREFEEIVVGSVVMKVEVVDTPERVQTGLSYREEIGSDGMLFALPRRGVPSFWMKGMRFGIDFVWIECAKGLGLSAEGCEVVDVIEGVLPPDDPEDRDQLQIYQPLAPVTHVLEVPAGWVEERRIGVENGVELSS